VDRFADFYFVLRCYTRPIPVRSGTTSTRHILRGYTDVESFACTDGPLPFLTCPGYDIQLHPHRFLALMTLAVDGP
jgi:hypothetical protein